LDIIDDIILFLIHSLFSTLFLVLHVLFNESVGIS
jgi:hypothetical protein